jgi:nucleotide-binding universal stress UspA family protein
MGGNMKKINNIVVPVDFEKNTQKLIDFAIDMASQLDSEVSFFHGVEYIAMGEMALGNFSYTDYTSERVKAAKKALEEIVENATGKCKTCRSKVVVGDVVDEVIDYAKNQNAHMIIMGTHGKRGIEKILLGSVADRVLKSAHCPVLVMNPYR